MRTLLVNPAMRVTLRIALPYSLAALPARPPCRLAAGDGRTGMARLRLPIGGQTGRFSGSRIEQPCRRAAGRPSGPAGRTARRTDDPTAEPPGRPTDRRPCGRTRGPPATLVKLRAGGRPH